MVVEISTVRSSDLLRRSMLKKILPLARDFIPDHRVHLRGGACVLLMAEALLKSWHAPAIVTEAAIDGELATATCTARTKVHSALKTEHASWTQNDEALPFPVDWQDPTVKVAAYSSDFIPAIDDQPLRVKNLKPGDYTLKIDGQEIATFRPIDQFARGINLAAFKTPMLKQSAQVLELTNQHIGLHLNRWRVVQVPLAQDGLPHYNAALTDLDALEQEVIARQRATAQPRPHFYEIVPKIVRNKTIEKEPSAAVQT